MLNVNKVVQLYACIFCCQDIAFTTLCPNREPAGEDASEFSKSRNKKKNIKPKEEESNLVAPDDQGHRQTDEFYARLSKG